MMLGSAPFNVGCKLNLDANTSQLFSEFGGVVVEIAEEAWNAFAAVAKKYGVPVTDMGRTTDDARFEVVGVFDVPFDDIERQHLGNIGSLLLG